MRQTQLSLLVNLERFEVVGQNIHVNGWVAHRQHPLTHLSLSLDDVPWVTRTPLRQRPDVLEHLRNIAPESSTSGIAIAAPFHHVTQSSRHTLTLIPIAEQTAVGEVQLAVRNFQLEQLRLPLPPFELAQRVGGHAGFLQTGQRIYHDIKTKVEQHKRLADMPAVLDWGCGSGRVTRYLMEDVPPGRIYGCDIDKSAIEWSHRQIKGPSFQQISPFPPTPYTSDTFDLIYGISVFTHLNEEMQFRWLKELQRILRPDGIVAVSVLNELFAPGHLKPQLRRTGIVDELSPQSSELAEYSTKDYYRVTYHSPKYIIEGWSKYFELLEYVEFGINSHQDLIIMTKK